MRPGEGEDVFDQDAPDASATLGIEPAHRLELGVRLVEPLERNDANQPSRVPGAEEGDDWVDQLLGLPRRRSTWPA
jgi:hypothetical protein